MSSTKSPTLLDEVLWNMRLKRYSVDTERVIQIGSNNSSSLCRMTEWQALLRD